MQPEARGRVPACVSDRPVTLGPDLAQRALAGRVTGAVRTSHHRHYLVACARACLFAVRMASVAGVADGLPLRSDEVVVLAQRWASLSRRQPAVLRVTFGQGPLEGGQRGEEGKESEQTVARWLALLARFYVGRFSLNSVNLVGTHGVGYPSEKLLLLARQKLAGEEPQHCCECGWEGGGEVL